MRLPWTSKETAQRGDNSYHSNSLDLGRWPGQSQGSHYAGEGTETQRASGPQPYPLSRELS